MKAKGRHQIFIIYFKKLIKAIIGVGLWAPPSLAQSNASIYFPPSKNKFRVLNQKLEFHMIDEKSMRLGRQLLTIDGMQMELTSKGDALVLKFTGPKQFMKSSQLLIRDPSGRALWKKEATGLKMITKKNPVTADGLRNDLRIYEETDDVDDILEAASEAVFCNFCLFHENETRRFNLCSADYNVSKVNGQWQLKSVKSNEQENRFIVNGVEVGSEGEIQFSKEITSLSLSAKLLSGLLVEIKTREVPLTLVDYEYQPNSPFLTLKVRENSLDDSSEEIREWQSKIQLNKPFFFIEAENQISLKQEIVIDGDLLADNEKPKIKFAQEKTYSSEVSLEIEKSPGDTLKALNRGDSVKNVNDSSVWLLKNLKSNQLSNRLIEFKKAGGKQTFVGTTEIFRGKPWQIDLFAGGAQASVEGSPDKIIHMGSRFSLKYHFTDFLFMPAASWNHLRWAVAGDLMADQYSENKQTHQLARNSLDLIYRLQPGLHTIDPAFFFSVGYQARSSETIKKSGPTLALGYFHPMVNGGVLGDRLGFKIKYSPSLSDADKWIINDSIVEATLESRYKITESDFDWSMAFSAEAETMQIKGSAKPISSTSFGLALGLHKAL